MKLRLMQLIACPQCKDELRLKDAVCQNIQSQGKEWSEVISGYLRCQGCKEEYFIKGGVPSLLIKNLHSSDKNKVTACY